MAAGGMADDEDDEAQLTAPVAWRGSALELGAAGVEGPEQGAGRGAAAPPMGATGQARALLPLRLALFELAAQSLHLWQPRAPPAALRAFSAAAARAATATPAQQQLPSSRAEPVPPAAAPPPTPSGSMAAAVAVCARDMALGFLCDAGLAEQPAAQAASTRALLACLGQLCCAALGDGAARRGAGAGMARSKAVRAGRSP